MPALTHRQYRSILDLVGDAHDAQDLADLRALLLPALRRIVPADYASYNEVTADGDAPVAVVEPELPAFAYEAWERHARSNPLIAHYSRTRDTRPYRFSDVVSMPELRRTALYRELYEPLGIEHQIAFGLPSPPALVIGIALSRGGAHDFSDDERTMLDIARPHLIQAYRNAQLRERLAGALEALRAGLDVNGAGALVVDRSGAVVIASRRGRELARKLTGTSIRDGDLLPGPLAGMLGNGNGQAPTLPDGERVLTHVVRSADGMSVMLLDTAVSALPPSKLEGLGLTPREAEALSQLARGLSTEEAAAELEMSPRTLHKHAERIHSKLGVHDRAQAVATAWAAVVAGGQRPD